LYRTKVNEMVSGNRAPGNPTSRRTDLGGKVGDRGIRGSQTREAGALVDLWRNAATLATGRRAREPGGRRAVAEQFADRREKLFGRQRDVEHLAARIRFKGRTAVVARPAMGKSWLLTELGRTLSDDHDPAHLVGFARSYDQTPDLRLRAVVDLRDEAESGVSTLQIAANCATILVSFIKQQAIIFGEGIV